MDPINHLIIGAGPAGLAVAGRLRQAGQDFTILEQTGQVGSAWATHYDRLCLHTVKGLSHLPGMDFPSNYPTYVPRRELLDYFEQYARKFNIEPNFHQEVTNIQRQDDHWIVTTNKTIYHTKSVIVTTGLNRVPVVPHWEGEQAFGGTIIHSRDYKNPTPYQGKKVLVIGMGNTGAEIALDLAEHGVETYLSVRSPIAIVPRDVAGRPVQVTAKTLDKLPWGIGDWLGTQIRKLVIGNLGKYGVPLSRVHPAVQLRETGNTPVIDLGTVAMIKEGKIQVVPDIARFTPNGVVLQDGRPLTIGATILATGYRANLEDFIPGISNFLDANGYPQSAIGFGGFTGMYFVGFDNYKLGGILGTIYQDSEEVVTALSHPRRG
ncbi:MAG: NAD(P)/FAD-dependent oxidoreductase [Saprospiraceae bacterium]|nr:NAD(P)/FAD-dependent oxidoreductase [Saprospiraceae bacterium]